MITITYNGTYSKITEAADFANQLLHSQELYDAIKANAFTHTAYTPHAVAAAIQNCHKTLLIRTYRPKWVFSKANAYVTLAQPLTIFLNSRKLWRSCGSIVNTLVHECVHIADYGDDPHGQINFGHGDNSYSSAKDSSAPYWIGKWAETHLQQLVDGTEDEEIAERDFNPELADK